MQEGRALREIPKPGDTLVGKYRIERCLAEGGMGVVVEATHLQLEERVAIKFLKPEVLGDGSSSEVITRFLREARAAIRIRSEHVVRVFDVATLDSGVPYIVMELLEGKDLDDLLAARGPLPVTESVDHVLQACEALGEAHALGIVHRDLKPANLFLTRTAAGVPIVKVLDFGISKLSGSAAGADMSMTTTQAVMGSPLYMSPEQMRSTRDTDARSDIWAMGVILYELLAGKPPFTGETMTQVCAAILQDTPITLGSQRKDIPPGLERVVMKCLEKRPQDRFASVADLAASLAPFASLVGQEAARRTSRSASFASSGKLALESSPALASASDRAPSLAATQKAGGPSVTSTAWGDEKKASRKSKAPLVVAGVAMIALVGVGAFALRGAAPPTSALGPTTSTSTSPSPSPSPSPSTSTSTSTSPSTSTSTSPLPSASVAATVTPRPAPTLTKPVVKKATTPTAAPKPSAPPPKASWNERK